MRYAAPNLTITSSRLHREALKQSATDPKTGIIDVGILTTGVSSSERIRRQLIAKELKKMLQVSSPGMVGWSRKRLSINDTVTFATGP